MSPLKFGDEITITVLSVKGKQVRLGFDAPDDVRIHREEIYERIQAKKTVSTDTSSMG